MLRLEEGRFRARPVRTMGSADVVAHARANGLAIAESDQLEIASGVRVPVLLVANFLDRDGSVA
jgi:molybdopterin biosynthesis enzyme